MRSKWRWIEKNLHVFLLADRLPDEFARLTRTLGSLLLDLFLARGVAPEVAETLARVVLEHAILLLPGNELSERDDPGWFEDWCRTMAERVHHNWIQDGKADERGDGLMKDPNSVVKIARGESALVVAFGFLTKRDRDLISSVLFEKIPLGEIARWLGVEEPQAREEYVKARNRLLDLLDADREIPSHIRRAFSGQDRQ